MTFKIELMFSCLIQFCISSCFSIFMLLKMTPMLTELRFCDFNFLKQLVEMVLVSLFQREAYSWDLYLKIHSRCFSIRLFVCLVHADVKTRV